MDSSCLICTEDFNSSKRAKVSCQYCRFEACSSCCQHYILDKKASVCMNVGKKADGSYICQREWTRKYVTANFPKAWVNKEWKQMNLTVGLEREKALLPATMAVVERMRSVEPLKKELEIVTELLANLTAKKQKLKWAIASGIAKTVDTSLDRRACPDESCRGFLNSELMCGVCDMWCCAKCHVIKGPRNDTSHTCEPDHLATVELLNKDTKACPACTTPIHKIEGCDQMWCTQCHTAFSWNTGRVETRIHNPHFYEWQRNNNNGHAPRVAGDDDACGRTLRVAGLIDAISLAILNAGIRKEDVIAANLNEMITRVVMFSRYDLGTYRPDHVVNNEKIRVKYIMGEIDEKKFASLAHSATMALEKNKEVFNILDLHQQCMTDIVFRLSRRLVLTTTQTLTPKTLARFSDEMIALSAFANTLLDDCSKTYGCKSYRINLQRYEGTEYIPFITRH
jgi:hypothetical protein